MLHLGEFVYFEPNIQSHNIHGTGIFTYIYHKNQPNVDTYTIHGWYGNVADYLLSVVIFRSTIDDARSSGMIVNCFLQHAVIGETLSQILNLYSL